MTGFSGHLTKRDGSHVILSSEEAELLWRNVEANEQRKRDLMPTEKSAINAMFDGYDRLRAFGWQDAIYCPKDGSAFQVIEAGSTGVHTAHYEGEWPKGTWWLHDEGDLWPSRPILFRLFPEDEEKRKVKMAAAAEKFRAETEADQQ